MAEPKDELPDDMRAGDTVIYHLPRNFHNDEDVFQGGHRMGLLTRVYRAKHSKRVAVDIIVALAEGDDPGHGSGILSVRDASYDSDCPPGTFCEFSEDSDEMPTVGDVKGALESVGDKPSNELPGEGLAKSSGQGDRSEEPKRGPNKPVSPDNSLPDRNPAHTPPLPGTENEKDSNPGVTKEDRSTTEASNLGLTENKEVGAGVSSSRQGDSSSAHANMKGKNK